MTYFAPNPVQHFFAEFMTNPDNERLGDFQIGLLDLEVSRAERNVLANPRVLALVGTLGDYKAELRQARRALKFARQRNGLNAAQLDLRFYWLTLLGHRLSVERGLSHGGRRALRHVAVMRLGLLPEETDMWSDGTLFRHYTLTVLRDEWDYPGNRFRYAMNA